MHGLRTSSSMNIVRCSARCARRHHRGNRPFDAEGLLLPEPLAAICAVQLVDYASSMEGTIESGSAEQLVP